MLFSGRPSLMRAFDAPILSVAVSALLAAVSAALASTSSEAADEHRRLLRQLGDRQQVATPYVVIDTRANRLHLRDEQHQIERTAVCATGAARRFEGRRNKSWEKWLFATPTGRFQITRKVADPLWTRPVWDFLEAGEEVPVFAEDPRRFQRGILGRYALYFLSQYMIHGTLYEVNLGKSITHGCVRVSDEDLGYLYERVRAGWPVYVF